MNDQDRSAENSGIEGSAGLGISRGKFIYYLIMLLPVLALLLGACGGGSQQEDRRGHP